MGIISELWQEFLRLFVASPSGLSIVYGFWLVLGLVYLYSNLYDKLHGIKKERKVVMRNYPLVIYAAGVVAAVLYFLASRYSWPAQLDVNSNTAKAMAGAGYAALGLGLLLTAWGRASINGLWGANIYTYPQGDDRLICTDAYAAIRHPIYAGQILMSWGTFLVSQSWAIVVFPAIVTVFAIVRGVREDKYLEQRYQTQFVEYRNRVGFMNPL